MKEAKIKISKDGRITIPKLLRDMANWPEDAQEVSILICDEGILLKKSEDETELIKSKFKNRMPQENASIPQF